MGSVLPGDQEDLDERTHQVGLMADIYSSASVVDIWLGNGDDNTEPAMGLINDLAMRMMEFWKTQNQPSYAEAKTTNHPIQYPPSEAPVWSAVKSLFLCPWFLRVWTFQEIVLARDAVFYCGAHTTKWERIETFLLGLHTYSQGPNIGDSRLKGAEKYALEIYTARSTLYGPKVYNPEYIKRFLGLFPLLESLRSRNTTDPRDKVFALLNVACDPKKSDLTADYRKSHAEVYTTTAKWLLRTQKSLAFLRLVEKKDKPDLISWVPDFRYKDHWNFLHQPMRGFRGPNHAYNASGTTNAIFIEEGSRSVEYMSGPLSTGLSHQVTSRTMWLSAPES